MSWSMEGVKSIVNHEEGRHLDIPLASLAGLMSTPMIRAAPAFLAPITAANPTPPNPQTATVDPGRTLAVFRAAPYPVAMPQPIKQTFSSGAFASIYKYRRELIFKFKSIQFKFWILLPCKCWSRRRPCTRWTLNSPAIDETQDYWSQHSIRYNQNIQKWPCCVWFVFRRRWTSSFHLPSNRPSIDCFDKTLWLF